MNLEKQFEKLGDLMYELALSCQGSRTGMGWAMKPPGYDERLQEEEEPGYVDIFPDMGGPSGFYINED